MAGRCDPQQKDGVPGQDLLQGVDEGNTFLLGNLPGQGKVGIRWIGQDQGTLPAGVSPVRLAGEHPSDHDQQKEQQQPALAHDWRCARFFWVAGFSLTHRCSSDSPAQCRKGDKDHGQCPKEDPGCQGVAPALKLEQRN